MPRTNLTNPTNNPEKLDPPFVPHSTGPIASERVRIRERAAKVEALIAQGRFRQNSEFPTTVQVDNKPMKLREPGAIRLTDLQQRMVAKSQKKAENYHKLTVIIPVNKLKKGKLDSHTTEQNRLRKDADNQAY